MDKELFAAVAVFLSVMLLSSCIIIIMLRRKLAANDRLLTEKLNAAIDTISRRTGFFSDMAHEMKTPLSVILGAVQLIEIKMKKYKFAEGEDWYSPHKNLGVIKSNCYRLMRLTNNLLDLTRMEAGYHVLKPVNCDLGVLIDEIVQSVKPYAMQKQLELRCDKPGEGIIAALDVEKMERVMLNLLSNAIKFTKPGGSICVSYRRTGDRVQIMVKDSGIGIPSENLSDIFNRYKQTGRNIIAENEGSGIGLSLVKSFVELHNGNIAVTSAIDRGSEFVIDLPVKHPGAGTAEIETVELSSRISEAARIEFSSIRSLSS